ncbi:putative bacteriophage protein [Klebsiella pneumoniae]|nr:putative bacteriophage protein [Klebsiella pneumoniae]
MPMTFDQATVDGTGAFLVHELERLDQTLNLPLVNFTWSRDIQLREDVSIADEISSFTNTTFAAAGTPNANGKNWLREGANKQVISSQADSLIKISRIWADFFPANTSNQPI